MSRRRHLPEPSFYKRSKPEPLVPPHVVPTLEKIGEDVAELMKRFAKPVTKGDFTLMPHFVPEPIRAIDWHVDGEPETPAWKFR